jgi:hypothetical protein
MNRQALEKPFPAEVIRTRKGAHGQLSYVEGAHYIRRLNEAFDGDWSWTILSKEVRENEVIVLGSLEIEGRFKQAFGGSRVTSKTTTGESVSLADDFKAASTDALKKACSLLGIGLDLYVSPEPGIEAAPQSAAPNRGYLREVPRDMAGPPRLTGKQLKAIYAIAGAHGISDADLKRQCKDAHGVMPEYLSKQDASALIEQLSGER